MDNILIITLMLLATVTVGSTWGRQTPSAALYAPVVPYEMFDDGTFADEALYTEQQQLQDAQQQQQKFKELERTSFNNWLKALLRQEDELIQMKHSKFNKVVPKPMEPQSVVPLQALDDAENELPDYITERASVPIRNLIKERNSKKNSNSCVYIWNIFWGTNNF